MTLAKIEMKWRFNDYDVVSGPAAAAAASVETNFKQLVKAGAATEAAAAGPDPTSASLNLHFISIFAIVISSYSDIFLV